MQSRGPAARRVRGPQNWSTGAQEHQKPVRGSLTDPLDAAAAVVMRRGCLGCGRASSQLKTVGSSLEQTCQKRILDAFPVGRGALDACRRAPRDAPDPWWLV